MTRTNFFGLALLAGVATVLSLGAALRSEEIGPIRSPSDLRIAVQYAQACEELAEVELAMAEDSNRKVPRSVPELQLDWLRVNVSVAKEQVRIAESLDNESTIPLQLALAKATAEHLQKEYESVRDARNRYRRSVTPLQLEAHRLKAEVANLRLAMWRQHPYVPSLIDQMQWQIDRHFEEIINLKHRLKTLEMNSR